MNKIFLTAISIIALTSQVGALAPKKSAPPVLNAAQAQPQPQPQPQQIQMPPPEAMIVMIRSSLVALSQANVTNNYGVLNALGSDNFRKANSPQRLGEIFTSFRTNKIDLSPVVYVTPQLNQQPKIENGKLRMIGYFPTQPMRVDYDLTYEPSGGVWKLYGISVNLNAAQQTSAQPVQFVPGQRR